MAGELARDLMNQDKNIPIYFIMLGPQYRLTRFDPFRYSFPPILQISNFGRMMM